MIPSNAMCFAMIVESLCRNQLNVLPNYVFEHPSVLDDLASHLENLNIVRALFALYTSSDEPILDAAWLTPRLLRGLHSYDSSDNCFAFLFKLISLLALEEFPRSPAVIPSPEDPGVVATLYQDIFASAAFREAFERDLLRLLSLRDRMDSEADNGCQLCFKAMRRVLELSHEKRFGSPFPRSVVQLPISLDDDAFPDDARSDNAIAFAFRQPLLDVLHRARATLLDVLQAFHAPDPVPRFPFSPHSQKRELCPKALPELLRLLGEAVCCERRASGALDQELLEALDAAMAGSVVCYYRNSFLHGTVKKIYKTLVDSRDPSIVQCAIFSFLTLIRSYHAE